MPDRTECVIFDLDGTLCVTDHRVHFARQKNYQAFHDACWADPLNVPVFRLYQALVPTKPIFLCSGRPDSHLDLTEVWLGQNGVSTYEHLLMRKAGDWRPDTVIKAEMLKRIRDELLFEPILAVDDRPSVIRMWREAGIPTLEIYSSNWDGTPERPAT